MKQRSRICRNHLISLLLTRTPSNFFSNKSLLSFPLKPSTLVLYQYLHAEVLPAPCYLPCLQVYNLEVLCLPLLLSGISSSCPELFTLTRKKGVNKLKLLRGDKLLLGFLLPLHVSSVLCLTETLPGSLLKVFHLVAKLGKQLMEMIYTGMGQVV